MSKFDHTFGGYRILSLIHESARSSVFRAVRKSDGQGVVLKMLRPDHLTETERNRHKQEYDILRKLNDVEGVIRAYALESYQKSVAIILEDFGGESLKTLSDQRLKTGRGQLLLSEFLDMAVHITQGLAGIHAAHVIHKDINPSNIVNNPKTGQLKIIDFRLSTALSREYPTLQSPGGMEGSLPYISPEQTGRMNRVVDYRTDLYSLGVTFYEMLTGRLPFRNEDPLALVHAHMAKVPRPVAIVNPGVPPIVSDIVMKLLAKNAEDRCQSASGLAADLERCRTALKSSPGSENPAGLCFELGEDDYHGQFQLPQRLYGRSAEIEMLLASFNRAAAGNQELMLVAGYAGVGKSALVAEVHKPMTRKRGCFISGKFDQVHQNKPYEAFAQACDQLAGLLLTEPGTTLRRWRDKILAGVGGNGAVLTEVMPGLESIIGKQPAVPKLGGVENRIRFNLTFRAFIQSISTAEHPMILFIDDWQWADPASLDLFKVLFTGEKIAHFLMIGAYRDNHVDRIHPFMMALETITDAEIPVRTIQLENLRPEDVQQLIQESLSSSTAESQALTQLVLEKTQGNAFFTRQFLQNLYEEGWLHFDFDTHRWLWDMEQLKAQNITDNVVALMTGKLRRITSDAAIMLQMAACIGKDFDMKTLALIGRVDTPTALKRLDQPLTQGLVVPLDDNYKLPDTALMARFTFLHDRVQQAAYAQISAQKRQSVHLEIGRLLAANTPETDLDQQVFSIVQHYNQAISLIGDQEERQQVAKLNIKAADLAYENAAFGSAQVYLEAASTLMPADAWTSHYDTMLRLHSQLATVFSLTGDVEQLEQVFQITETHARTMADTARVKQAKIQSLLYSGDYAAAIEVGLTFVQGMGIPVNPDPSAKEAFHYLQETAEWLTLARIETLRHLPEAPAEIGLILEVALVTNGPTFNSNMPLHFMFVSQMARLCVEQGLTPWAPVTLMTFASILIAALHDIPKARLLAEKTMQLFEERYHADNPVSPLSLLMGGFIVHRYDHLKHTLPILIEGVQKGLTTGTFQFVGYCAWRQVWHQLFLGEPLPKAEAVSQQAEEICQKIQLARMKDGCLLIHQAILNLQDKSEVPWILKGDVYDEQEKLALALQMNDMSDMFRIYFYKAWLHYLFEHPQESVELFLETESYLVYGSGSYLIPLFYFYDTLANALVFAPHAAQEHTQIIKRIKRNLEEFEVWARFAPMNHQHKKDLMEAELARIEGKCWEAATFYQKAIQGARENGFLPEEALSYELCGRFWLDQGNEEIAYLQLHKALHLYGTWGAAAKVKQLEDKYKFALDARQPRLKGVTDMSGTPSIEASWLSGETTQSLLDIASLLKVNQSLSQAMTLSALLTEMIRILLENSGAERAFVLHEDEGDWFIEAAGDVKEQAVQTGLHVSLSYETRLSQSVFNYVINSGQSVVLANASEDPQFDDAYLRENEVKSVLCLPIWHEGELRLILYLENNLIVGAFTEARLELLQLLSGQMAISMEKVRTEEAFRKSEAALRESEEKYRVLFDSFPLAVSVTDEDGNIIEVNKMAKALLGISKEEQVGRSYSSKEWKIVKPDGTPMPVEEFAGVRAKRENRTVENVEMGIIKETGECVWLNVTAAPIPLEGFGQAIAYLDITDRRRVEEELRQSEATLKSIFKAVPVGISIMKNRIYQSVNDFFYESLGYREHDIIGKDPRILYESDEEFERVRRELYDHLQERGLTSVETRLRRKDGVFRDVVLSTAPLHANDPSTGTVGAVHDITDRRRVEEELRQSESTLKSIFKAVPVGISIMKNRIYQSVNDFFYESLGYREHDIIGKDPRILYESDEEFERAGRELYGQLQERGLTTIETRLRRSDGVLRDVVVNVALLRGDDPSAGTVGVIHDVTERKQAEEALRLSESRYRNIFENAAVDIWEEDFSQVKYIVDGLKARGIKNVREHLNRHPEIVLEAIRAVKVLAVNNHCVKTYGSKSEDELLGSFFKIFLPESLKTFSEEMIAIAEGRRQFQTESVTQSLQGERRDILVTISFPDTESSFNSVLVSTVDITKRKLAEEELAKYREHLEELVQERTRELEAAQEELVKRERLSVLGQLTATVSHELRNPLGVIRSSAFYLQEKEKGADEKIRKHLRRIEAQVELCDEIVGELLEYTRGSGSEMEKTEITSWLGRVLEEFRDTEGILISRTLSGDLPKVFLDRGKMGRVMTNLLHNAVHAVHEKMNTGKAEGDAFNPEIRVSTKYAEGGVIIEVEDNGVGMDEGTMRKAPEPLFTTKARGTGLGLAIVKKIMEEHGGGVRLESEVHKGTKVSIWIPVRRGSS